jgi:hypothetical protein
VCAVPFAVELYLVQLTHSVNPALRFGLRNALDPGAQIVGYVPHNSFLARRHPLPYSFHWLVS